MRVSRHNGRSGFHGAYNPKHNDREFDVDKADGVREEMTPHNIYWNCIDNRIVSHGDLSEKDTSFTESEKIFYETNYHDFLEGQNERHIASRHKERCRTMDDLRENPKTCPEETIYQIGNIDSHVDPVKLGQIALDFFREHQKRYGDHVHILNWSLHLDESTPHIHERHVFDVVNNYGERCPKQEQACKEMGFKLPDPAKKPGRYNNRKMSYDAACRQLLLSICKKHGLEIEEEPIYGGVAYQEKQEYVSEKLSTEIEDKQKKLSDIDALVNEISDIAYEKACETLIVPIVEESNKEHNNEIEDYKKWLMSDERKASIQTRSYASERISQVQARLSNAKSRVISAIKKVFKLPEKKAVYTKEIARAAKPSIRELLSKAKDRVAVEEAERNNKENRTIERKDRSYER